ncbi:MAG: OFA family oxalate/formate antiporter-like MFS transporter [Paracoccaceae bacterium]
MTITSQKQALFGASILSFILGSVHSFSVLLLVMEVKFDVSRSAASLTYSLALISIAIAVLFGHRFYHRFRPPIYVTATGVLAATGCILAALSPTAPLVWVGFGLIFGAANGLGYGYALQFSGRAYRDRKGFAMGVITASYALGAVVFPLPLRLAIELGGWSMALLFLALCLLVFSAISALMLAQSKITYTHDAETAGQTITGMRSQIILLWLSYCGAVTAGLMVIGHATGVSETRGGGAFWIVAAPIVIATANMAGSMLGGILIDRVRGHIVLASLAALSSITLLSMAFVSNLMFTLMGLAVIGFTYGGTIAAYPAYISNRFGGSLGTVVYGRVFTAWAAAGLLGPLAAGLLFDTYSNYRLALILAAIAALGSAYLMAVKNRS